MMTDHESEMNALKDQVKILLISKLYKLAVLQNYPFFRKKL